MAKAKTMIAKAGMGGGRDYKLDIFVGLFQSYIWLNYVLLLYFLGICNRNSEWCR